MVKMNVNGPKPIAYGMIGGGKTGYIGKVHRTAAEMFGRFKLYAGMFSSDTQVSLESAVELGVSPDRNYQSLEEMALKEKARRDGIKAVVIATPNHLHGEAITTFSKAGFHVICDKPLTATLDEALHVSSVVSQSRKLFLITYCYTGYPMVREAKSRIANGEIGNVRMVKVEYPQGHLAMPMEKTGQKKFQWRTDPRRSGQGGTVADIGTHAFHMLRFITGLKALSLSAELNAFVEGRPVDDNAVVNLRLENGGIGLLWASQVAIGHENSLNIKVYGDKGSIEWSHKEPSNLWVYRLNHPKQLITRGSPETTPQSRRVTHIPAGHPEGYHEAFANLYQEAATAIEELEAQGSVSSEVDYPGIDDGVEGMKFVAAALTSTKDDGRWTEID